MYLLAAIGPEPSLDDGLRRLEPHWDMFVDAAERVTGWHARFEVLRPDPRAVLVVDASTPGLRVARRDGVVAVVGGDVLDVGDASARLAHEASSLDDADGEFLGLRLRIDGRPAIDAMVDAFASWPLTVAQDPSTAVATNDPLSAAVMLGLRELDEEVVYQVLRYGYALSSATTIRGVRRLLPAGSWQAHLDARDAVVVAERTRGRLEYTDIPAGPVDRTIDARRSFDALRRAARDRVTRAAAAPGAIRFQLSGGLDSRLTCAAIASEGVGGAGRSVTYDISDRAEVEIAATVANRLGLAHDVLALAGAKASDLRDGWLLTGGQLSAHAGAGNVIGYRSIALGEPLVLVGAWPGDVLAGSRVPPTAEYLDPSRVTTACRRWASDRAYPAAAIGRHLDRAFVRAHSRLAEQLLSDGVIAQEGPTAAHRVTLWAMNVQQPTFSFVSPARLLPSVREVTPCLDRQYLAPFLRLRAEELVGKQFYRSLIYQELAALRDVPYARTGKVITAEQTAIAASPSTFRELLERTRGAIRRPLAPLVMATAGRFRPTRSAPGVEHGTWLRLLRESDLGESQYAGRSGYRIPSEKDVTPWDIQLLGALTAVEWTRRHLASMA